MTRILLIRTGSISPFDTKVTQPLGLLSVASYLLAYPANDVSILDLQLAPLATSHIIDRVIKYMPDFIGFSVLPYDAPHFNLLSKEIKKAFPKIPLIAGGVYPTVQTAMLFKNSACDYAILGEGEIAALKLIQALLNKEKSPPVPATAHIKDGELVIYKRASYIDNLDSLAYPAWDKIPITAYFNVPRTFPLYAHKEYMSIFTSRGCPFGCTFCHSMFGKAFRARSADNVFLEIETLHKRYGIKEFQIVDDCFNYDITRAKQICDRIINSGLNIALSFPNGIRGDILDNELLLKLKQAGTYALCFGVQSGSHRIQSECGSHINLDRLAQAVNATDKYKMIAYGYCMIGFMGESVKELYETLNFIKRNRFHGATFFFTTPYPGTRMYEEAKKGGVLNPLIDMPQKNDEHPVLNEGITRKSKNKHGVIVKNAAKEYPDYRFAPGISNSKLSPMRLQLFQLYANSSIYFSIWRIFRLFYLIPNKKVIMTTVLLYLQRITLFIPKFRIFARRNNRDRCYDKDNVKNPFF